MKDRNGSRISKSSLSRQQLKVIADDTPKRTYKRDIWCLSLIGLSSVGGMGMCSNLEEYGYQLPDVRK